MQLLLAKLPPNTLEVHDTVPVGAVFVPELVVSVTVAVKVCLPPWATDAELGNNTVDDALSSTLNSLVYPRHPPMSLQGGLSDIV